MSVKLLYGIQNKDFCAEAEKLGGFCYCRLNPTGKSYGDKIYKNVRKVGIDLAKYTPVSELSRENPIEMSLDFGIVPVESKTFRDIIVYNSKGLKTRLSQSHIYVEPREELMENYDKVFHILLEERLDLLPALKNPKQTRSYLDGQFRFRVLFKPKLAATAYTTTLFVWIGGIPIKLKCHGFSEGPFVALSQNVINFGGQYYGSDASIRIDMMNHSICDAHFQFDCDNYRSAFKICPVSGIIPASSTIKLIVVFRPHKPQTFYKRIYCLLHQQHPQYIDVLGVCIPRPFFVANPIDFCVSLVDTQFLPLPTPTFEEYFLHDLWGLRLSQEDFNFGGKNVNKIGPSGVGEDSTMTFTLTSSLPYDVLVEWVRDPTQVFVVSPQSTFLNAHQSIVFNLSFCPQFPDTFFGGQLECYIYPTTYIWPPRHGPPWIYAKRKTHAVQSRPTTTDKKEEKIEIASVPEKQKASEHDEYHHSSLPTTAESFRPPSLENAVEELGEDEIDLWTRKKHIPPVQYEQIPGQINFQLCIKNEKVSVHHRIASKQHYRSTSLFDAESFQKDFSCKEKDIQPSVEVEEIEEEYEAEAETEVEKEIEEEVVAEQTKQKKAPSIVLSKKNKKKKNDEIKKTGSSKKGKKSKKSKEKKEMKAEKDEKEKKKKPKKEGKKKKRKEKNESIKPLDIVADVADVNENVTDKEEQVFEVEDQAETLEKDFENSQVEQLPSDILAMGDAYSDHLLKREHSFTVPQSGISDTSDPTELALPLCLTIRVAGHSYDSTTQPPIPHFNIPSRVVMSPTIPQHREFRTIIMKNTSDLPILFDIKGFDESENYSAKPLIGVIPGEEKQILMISMNTASPETAAYNHTCSVNFNVIDKNPVSIFGYAEVPSMTITLLSDPTESVQEIICPTTVPGYCTSACMTMKNPSRFHYRFFLEFVDEDPRLKFVFTPTPAEGIIAPYDSVKIVWKFVPYDYLAYSVPWRWNFEVLGCKTDDNFWNAVFEFILPLSGFGKECYLSVSPKVLDFDLIQIFDSVSKSFTITNEGASVVAANLIIFHEQWLQWYNKDQIKISPSQIHLEAGEKVDINVTVRADRPIMYKFHVQYELEKGEKNPEGNPISQSELNHLIDIIFMGDHTVAQITHIQQIAKHPAWDVAEAWAMFSITKLNELMTHTAREGSLPNVPPVTFRFPAASLDSQPALFALVLTNMSDNKQYWQIYTQPPKNNKLYQLRHKNRRESFVGSGDVQSQDSPSFLTVLWTEKYAELGKESKISSKLQRDSSLTMVALKNSENFRVTPTSGTIQNRKKQQINFKFTYDAVGEFRMPILLRVFPGVFVWLELEGTTLEPNQPSLQLMHQNEMIFHPIGLSDIDPPLQIFWIYNGGVVQTNFQVDMEPFQEIKRQNFGHSCIECLTSEGVALPKSWTQIKLKFSPLEFRTYTAPLRIKSNDVWQIVQLKGKTTIDEQIFFHPISPEYPSPPIFDPFVPIVLIPSRVVFPHFIPTGDCKTSLIFITNMSSEHSMSFAWPENTVINGTIIKFLPGIGILAPKEQCACQITINAGSVNQILSTTIRCWIEDVTAVNEFQPSDKLWNGEFEEYKEITVVTEKEGPHKVRQAVSHHQPHKSFSYSRLLGISCYIGSVFGMLDNNLIGEKMIFSDSIGIQPLPECATENLSPMDRHLTKEVISEI